MRLDIKTGDTKVVTEKRNILVTVDDLPRSDAHDFIEKADLILRDFVWLQTAEDTKYLSYKEMKKLTAESDHADKREELLSLFEKAKYSSD